MNQVNTIPVNFIKKDHDFTIHFPDLRGKELKKFAAKGLRINLVKKRAFCGGDFPEMKRDNYRKYIQKLKPYLELVIDGKPKFWKIMGVQLPGYSRKFLFRDTGGGVQFEKLLESLNHEHPKFHDIKIKVYHDGELYYKLLDKGFSPNRYNKCISYNFSGIKPSLETKSSIYENIIQIDIGCSNEPLIYDISSFLELIEHLSYFSHSVCGLAGSHSLPFVYEWILTHYHLNLDSSIEYSGKSFEVKINDVGQGLIRYYSKKFPNGKTTARLEQIKTPKKTILETVTEMASKLN